MSTTTEAEGLALYRATLPEHRRHEYIRILHRAWDIVAGYYNAEVSGQQPIAIAPADFAGVFDLHKRPEQLGYSFYGLSPTEARWALRQADTTQPILVGDFTDGRTRGMSGHWLLDGRHRLYKAFQLGESTIPAIVLSCADTERIRIR